MHESWIGPEIVNQRAKVLYGPAGLRAGALAELEELIRKEARHDERNRIMSELGARRQFIADHRPSR